MRKRIRTSVLRALKSAGVFARVLDSKWRRRRLLILCYHGFAIDHENSWRPALFLQPSRLRSRFEMLKRGGYTVLPLAEGIERLQRNNLPPRSVALTFDDGTYDFHKLAYPLLKEYGFPATVYQTTYYCSHLMPVFHLICSYMLWTKRDQILHAAPSIGIEQDLRLADPGALETVTRQIVGFAEREKLSTEQKNEVAAELSRRLGVDYKEIARQRILQLMTTEEIAELAAAGVDFELHTHRHRMPRDRDLFRKEIGENRAFLQKFTGSSPHHFCYPSGEYDSLFLPWLKEEGVLSATTCEPGLATSRDEPLLLPRFIDTTGQSELEFESWITGVGALLKAGVSAARLPTVSHQNEA
jgi:peptidoglycan/xylan/chitin deacetylase (PgdA/CDA1 family)